MADRRMFAKAIVLSDTFMRLPVTAKCLYYTLGVIAYDKGIVINAISTARAIGCSDKDVEILVENKFLREIEDGHYQIVHWYENNGIGETAKKRNNYTYRKWRIAVIERDGKRCSKCGAEDDLQVHHIKSFADRPDLRFRVDNGITLCRKCHKQLHKEKRERE